MSRSWLILGTVAFGVGFSLSLLSSRDLKKAFFTGACALPAAYAGNMVVALRQKNQLGAALTAFQTPTAREEINPVKDQIAVFWDYENAKVSAKGINVPLAEALMAYSESLGHPRLKTVYSNWRRENEVVVQALYSLGFEPIHVSMGKPNSVDVKLTVDCLNAAYRYPSIKRFIIVTADKDFIPLVNALKAMEKQVTIIGRTEMVSEQLMLSADEFVSLEQLSEDTTEPRERVNKALPQTTSYKDAVECLLKAISEARSQGKSTRFGVIDTLMRDNKDFHYQGVSSVRKDDGTTFSKFSEFIDAVEQDGSVQVQTVEGFKELFLIGEDPTVESEFSSQAGKIEREHWLVIIDQIKRALESGEPSHPLYGRFMILFKFVREARKSGKLPHTHTNRTIQDALGRLVEVGVLVKQADESYRLVENLEEKKEDYLDELMKEK